MPNIRNILAKRPEDSTEDISLDNCPIGEETYLEAMRYIVRCHIKYASLELPVVSSKDPAAIAKMAMENYDDGIREEFETELSNLLSEEFLDI